MRTHYLEGMEPKNKNLILVSGKERIKPRTKPKILWLISSLSELGFYFFT